MENLGYRYVMYVTELKKGYPKGWLFRPLIWLFFKRYRSKLKKRLALLEEQHNNGLVKKEVYTIWKKMIKEVL